MATRAPDQATTAARQAAWLFAVSGAMALGSAPLHAGKEAALAIVAALDLALGAVVWRLPWHRWRHEATLAMVVPAIAVVGGVQAFGLFPTRSYGVCFVLFCAWIGLHHEPGTTLKLAPVVTAGYCLPLLLTHAEPPLDPASALVVVGVGVMVAETIARAIATSATAQERARRAARSFATVGAATAALVELDDEAVLATAVDTVMELGYDGVKLTVVDAATQTFEVRRAGGIAADLPAGRFPLTEGLTGLVVASGQPVVVDDYQASHARIPAMQVTGARTAIAVPVVARGELVAVLVACYARIEPVEPEDVEALRIVAAHAGAAIGALRRLGAERALSAQRARESRTDALTGVLNRRGAQERMAQLRPGDAIALIDVDHFKAVNDVLGHAAGDQILQALAGFLAGNTRSGDRVARFGGEEFLLILPRTSAAGAATLVDRLRRRWETTHPTVTFSAGTAENAADDFPATTLGRADAALYDAKTGGRNRVVASSTNELAPA